MPRRSDRLLIVALLLGLLTILTGCRGDAQALRLDGSPRYPDVEGVVVAASRDGLVLEDGRRFEVSPQLRSFSTYNLEPLPLIHRVSQYVQVGLDGDTAVWIATIGRVVDGDPPVVLYTGELVAVDRDGRAVFKDGTVLRLAEGVDTPASGSFVTAYIDPVRQVAVSLS